MDQSTKALALAAFLGSFAVGLKVDQAESTFERLWAAGAISFDSTSKTLTAPGAGAGALTAALLKGGLICSTPDLKLNLDSTGQSCYLLPPTDEGAPV